MQSPVECTLTTCILKTEEGCFMLPIQLQAVPHSSMTRLTQLCAAWAPASWLGDCAGALCWPGTGVSSPQLCPATHTHTQLLSRCLKELKQSRGTHKQHAHLCACLWSVLPLHTVWRCPFLCCNVLLINRWTLARTHTIAPSMLGRTQPTRDVCCDPVFALSTMFCLLLVYLRTSRQPALLSRRHNSHAQPTRCPTLHQPEAICNLLLLLLLIRPRLHYTPINA